MDDDSWCTIESDPGVFTELIESIGVRGVQVEELYSLDQDSFARLAPVYGLVFLFKWTGQKDERPTVDANDHSGLFFARQVITNACATQAILSVLLNCQEKVDIGETLTEFKSFTGEFPPDMKGLAISNSEQIRAVHNGFSRQEPFFNDGKEHGGKREDAFHFVAYVPHKGKVFELDGLKPGPIVLGDVPGSADVGTGEGGGGGQEWLDVASPAIEERIARYSSDEIRFNLLAIVKNRKQVATEGKEMCMRCVEEIEATIQQKRAMMTGLQTAGSHPVLIEGMEELERKKAAELEKAEELEATVRSEEDKRTQWREENKRRKHNYIPFAVTLLKLLAEKGELQRLADSAMSKATERRDANAEKSKQGTVS